MSSLQVILTFLELERAIRVVAMSDDVSKNVRTLLEEACDQHHKRLVNTVSIECSQTLTGTPQKARGV